MNADDRLTLLTPCGLRDVTELSQGAFGPDIQAIYDQWAQFTAWARQHAAHGTREDLPDASVTIGSPAPRPRQVFAIGLNYRDHAAESRLGAPETPAVFTKFPACLTGPYGD